MKFANSSESFKKLNRHLFQPQIEYPVPAPNPNRDDLRLEKELQRLIYADLLRRGLYFHYQRSDKATTGTVGSPDFILPYKGQFLAIECKTETGRLSKTQIEVLEKIEAQDGSYYIVRSFDAYQRLMGFGRMQENFSDNEVPK